jgi:hypothetical protein
MKIARIDILRKLMKSLLLSNMMTILNATLLVLETHKCSPLNILKMTAKDLSIVLLRMSWKPETQNSTVPQSFSKNSVVGLAKWSTNTESSLLIQ